ncbi:phosphate ABC transporter permease PstA [Paenibacillus mucilaginosus]|uniref:Phosphate transport system permease protein PstA n=3 Tax=Paenibacillus mucilaginosus TaxID=61624 RepID=H6NCC3_9BACL|nr:phosphate ABC transporter permease PstA [Paenibacillus mucilaginosus]AEI39861.1 phosphate ABC transporter, permease protein [Paenibacillus mucilaginosus KNP414]AFC28536.1 phosphate ABC transporter permease [Paenibacillus mucilaginosus 3016]AFH60702.1 phosphate ABC transporter permease [Paenibacillus mucilaginosus K02]MCG7217181.1 phosphate ABC transporter permease PstA [Paenibacillus mucilaginosus]WDM29139.1 phosphate ABC transporter permease PstA [Paenibacillus mucilaginosus]
MTSKVTDRIATAFFWASGAVIIAILAWFLVRILGDGLPMLSWNFITGRPSEIDAGGGVGPQLFNSFYILFLSLLFSLPIGIGAGIYLAVYAKKSAFTDFIRVSVEALSSVPSIVFGLFGFLLFVNWFGLKYSIIGGAATLSLLNLPVLVRVTEESIRSVPESYWEASLALGSTRWQAIRKVLLPSAMPSLITGITLVAGRALGESAILIYTAGLSVSRILPDFNPLAMGETLATHLWYVQSEAIVPDAKQIAQGSAALLLLVVLAFNLLIGIPSRILQKKLSGGK